jgi:O-antigen/teichoic acid export membrane protein
LDKDLTLFCHNCESLDGSSARSDKTGMNPDDASRAATTANSPPVGSGVSRDAAVMLPLYGLIRKGIELVCEPTARKGMVTLADQAVVSATNFVTGVIIGRACTKEEFGLYMLGLTIMLYVTNLQTSLILTPYMIFSPRLKGNAQALYTGSTLIHQLALSALTIICLAIGGVVISLGMGPQELAPIVWALVVVIAFILLRDYARQVCFARLQMRTALLLDSCIAVGQIGGLLLLAYLGVLSASRTYWVIGVACGLAVLAWLIWIRTEFTLRISQAILDLGHSWSFGKWVVASGLLWTLSMSLYPWFLAGFHGTASAGVWAACLGIVAIGNPLLFGVSNVLGPMIAHSFAEGGRSALRRFALKASLAFSALMIPLCLILLVFGGSLMARLYGANYTGNGMVVSVLAVNLLVSASAFIFSRSLFAVGRADMDFMVNFAALFVLLTLGLWLVRAWGPLGAAYGLLIANIAALVPRVVVAAVLTGSSRRGQTG